MSVGDHFRRAGYIHGIWIICILLAIIGGLMLRMPNGDKVAEYISFASSIASLVLAVVAIFYSIISNQSIAENLGSMDTATTRIDKASDQLEFIANSIENNFSKIFEEFGSITPEMKKISDNVEKAFAPQTEVAPALNKGEESSDIAVNIIDNIYSTIGSTATWYMISQSIKNDKTVNIGDIFGKNTPFEYYVGGYLTALESSQKEIKIIKDNIEGKIFYTFKYDGENPRIDSISLNSAQEIKEQIDKYFSD